MADTNGEQPMNKKTVEAELEKLRSIGGKTMKESKRSTAPLVITCHCYHTLKTLTHPCQFGTVYIKVPTD